MKEDSIEEQLDSLLDHMSQAGYRQYLYGDNYEHGESLKQIKKRLLALIESVKAKHSAYVIGQDVKPKMGGKEIKRGQTVTIDMENNLRESCDFIQANGQYLLQQEQRKRAGLQTEEPKEDI